MNVATLERWIQMLRWATKDDVSIEDYTSLVRKYSEPHRYYHNLHHISDCLEWFDRFTSLAHEPFAVELAIWFHDIIYDSRASNNEERSAEIARDWLRKLNLETGLLDSVSRLILATKSHDGSLHPDAPLLVDIDLVIFGQPEARFWQYEDQIRQEYEWVPMNIFCAKRAEILEGFLSRKQIYQTDALFQELETQARINLKASVYRLKQSVIP